MIYHEPVPTFWWVWSGVGWTVAGLYVTWTPGTPPLAPYACGVAVLVCLFGVVHNLVHRLRNRRPKPRHTARRTNQ